MLKKTTIYIEEKELNALKGLSLIQKKSVTELIRLGVKKVCLSADREEIKVLGSLDKIRKNIKKRGCSSKKLTTLALKAQKEARNERKKRENFINY